MGYGTSPASHAQLLYSILLCVLVSRIAAAKEYVWKEGRWHECQHYQCGEGGSQVRSVFCGEKYNYNEVEAANCRHLPKPETTRSCFKVCAHHQNLLRWAPYEWTDCMLSEEYRECSIKHGVRYRNVTCVWKDTGFVEEDSVCAEFVPKPETEERCKLKCPQDCVVSSFSFSFWNNCDTCLLVNKTRTRQLIVPPNNGGKPCPTFTDMLPCDNCSETYTYKMGAWGKCTPFDHYMKMRDNIHPLLGSQKRIIQCIDSKGNPVSYQKCIDYLRSSSTELLDRQTCVIPQDCQVDKYSEMMPYNTSCFLPSGRRRPGFMIRTRRVMQVPLGTGKSCPPLVHFFPVQSSDEQQCPRYFWKMSNWSECRTPSGGYPCTVGLQTRDAICIEQDDIGRVKPTNSEHCTASHQLTARTCQAECDIDCVVSQWTEWSECKVTDCELYLRRRRNNEGTGQRHRTREVLTRSRGQGQRCLHLSETQMCDPQPCYHWNITVGHCRLLHSNTSPACGLGIAYRTLTCINKLGGKKRKRPKNKSRPSWRFRPYEGYAEDEVEEETSQLRVADVKCEELQERPAEKEDCNIPCPDDCILSPWSPWSPCPSLCQEGRSRPAQQKRERTILAQPGQDASSCPLNRELLQVQICPTTIECAIYVWQTEPWGRCIINDPSRSCGPGRQTRDVKCYSLAGQLVSEQRCTLDVKPSESQACSVPCPVDCEVTEYSDWSPCSSTCWEAKQTVPVMTRVRYIIQNPANGGKPCPIKLQEVRQCMNLTLCQRFYWDTSVWSRCVLPLHKIPPCGQGLQARDISCKSENGTAMPVDVCVREIGVMPPVARVCHKSCDAECRFDEWSEWSKCINGCNGNRFRTRKLIEDPDLVDDPKTARCRDRRLYPVDSFEKCLCDAHTAVPIGNWSECILESDKEFYKLPRTFQGYTLEGERTKEDSAPSFRPSASVGVNAVCGQGKRYKVLACQNDIGEVEAANQCTLKPYEIEKCLIPCPVDCIMSTWSQWTDCSTSCGMGTQNRYRHIKQIPSDGGRQCPVLDDSGKETQTRVCNMHCRRYLWQTLRWSPCMAYRYPTSRCGNGTQSRNVRCVLMTEEGFEQENADVNMCRHLLRPPDTQKCIAPCVGECVLSDWADWSRCQQPCSNPNQVQTRTRMVLRQPSSDPRNTCPSTLEERFCIRGENCVEYSWQMAPWTTCLVNNGQAECGKGHKQRYPRCFNQIDTEVDPKLCTEALGESTEMRITSCEIPCDVDCLLTEWSPWSSCSSSCGLGNQIRTRDVVQEPKGYGRPCPSIHQQEKPCFLRGCYMWVVSPWSMCMGHSGVCGQGLQSRNISCVADGGLQVNESNCEADLDIVILETQRPCSVPCPGECVMSEWSEWNDCFLHCKDYSRAGFTRGVQSRSRAVLAYAQPNHSVCPEQLWESRPCEVSTCFTFLWKTSPWTPIKTRRVWCERSDGLLVEGGCPEHSKPSSTLSCNPPCSVPNSVCNNTNVCVCAPSYKPAHNRLSVLIECSKMDNSTETNPSPKSVTLPTDGPTNVWMYAVIAAGTLFVIFLAVACYTMSEFFHKGPRPRKKDEEKSIEGADNVEGMVAETEFASCNHVAPVAAISELDSQSVISADRTPPQSVRAHACNGNAGMPRQPPAAPRPLSVSDRQPRGAEAPDCVGQHFSVLLHEPSDSPGNVDRVWKQHATKQHGNSSLKVHDNLDIDKLNSDRALHDRFVDNTQAKSNQKVQNTQSCADTSQLYAEVDRKGAIKSSVAKPKEIDKNENYISRNNVGKYSKSKMTHMEVNRHIGEKLSGTDMPDTVFPVMHGIDDRNKVTFKSNNSQELPSHAEDIVYMNREASDAEDDPMIEVGDKRNSRNSISLNNFLQTVLQKIDNITSGGDDELQDNDDVTNNTHAQFSEDVHMESASVSEPEVEPLLGTLNGVSCKDSRKRPSAFSTKSSSMERQLSDLDSQTQSTQMLDSDDDAASKTQSLRSHMSSRSRTSHLSCSHGPVIKIDPEEAGVYDMNRNSLPQSMYSNKYPSLPLPSRSATFSNQRMNIGYISLSSIDTELSTAPSSSCDSLSPRSLPSESMSECSAVDNLQIRAMDTGSEKTPRNVALGSIKNANSLKKQLKNLDPEVFRDSGTESLNLSIDSSPDKPGHSVNSYMPVKLNNIPPAIIEADSITLETGIYEPAQHDKHFVKPNHHNGFHSNGKQEHHSKHLHPDEGALLAPVHFLNLKSKRETLVKQGCSDDLDCSEV